MEKFSGEHTGVRITEEAISKILKEWNIEFEKDSTLHMAERLVEQRDAVDRYAVEKKS